MVCFLLFDIMILLTRLIKRFGALFSSMDHIKIFFSNVVTDMKLRIDNELDKTHPLWNKFLDDNLTSSEENKRLPHLSIQDINRLFFTREQMKINRLINRYQWDGHMLAALDPLGEVRGAYSPNALSIEEYASSSLLPYDTSKNVLIINMLGFNRRWLPVDVTLDLLNNTYCRSVGIENYNSWSKIKWATDHFHNRDVYKHGTEYSAAVSLRRMLEAYSFEEWASKVFPVAHSGLGSEMVSVALQTLVDIATEHNARHFDFAMSTTRGRLNIMLNAFRKPAEHVLAALPDFSFKSRYLEEDDRYGLGFNSAKVSTQANQPVVLHLLANDPNYPDTLLSLLLGKTKADQVLHFDFTGTLVWPIFIHGDLALKSHGSTFEAMALSNNRNYNLYGTMHIVITDNRNLPNIKKKPSSCYCTDIFLTKKAPVIHVNAEDEEAVLYSVEKAVKYRSKYFSDIIIDFVCAPREKVLANPKYLQKRLIENEFLIKQIHGDKEYPIWQSVDALKDYYSMKNNQREFYFIDWVSSPWKGLSNDKYVTPITGADIKVFETILNQIINFHLDIKIDPSVQKLVSYHFHLAKEGIFNWYMAETIAISLMLHERFHFRLSGRGCLDGEFMKRYFRLYSKDNDVQRLPIRDIFKPKGDFMVCSTEGSENATLGFEIGFSLASWKTITLWQSNTDHGFSNIQFLLDIFIAGGEIRFLRQKGPVLLFFYGHSEKDKVWDQIKINRILQLSIVSPGPKREKLNQELAKCCFIILNITTPANYFHALRRQSYLHFRKPLIIFLSKYLVSTELSSSVKSEFVGNTVFREYIEDSSFSSDIDVKKLLICTGDVYFDLVRERDKLGTTSYVAISRVEQINPFPQENFKKDFEKYPDAVVYWVQVEPKNRGWWGFVKRRLQAVLPKEKQCKYIGRGCNPHRVINHEETAQIVKLAVSV